MSFSAVLRRESEKRLSSDLRCSPHKQHRPTQGCRVQSWPVLLQSLGRELCPPVNFAPVERFGVEGDGGGVAALGTADGDFSAQFHPGHGEDGAGVGAGQREDVLLIVLQQTKDS